MNNDFGFGTLFPGLAAFEPGWKIMARLQIEMIALSSRRARAYLELPSTLARCHSTQDVLTEQVLFWQVAQRQYAQGVERTVVPVPTVVAASTTEVASPSRSRDYMVVSDREPVAAPQREPAARDVRAPVSAPKVRRSA
jgi:hypothetical protein